MATTSPDRIIFAQLCKKLTPVELNNATVVELMGSDSNPIPVSGLEFEEIFYKHNGVFSLTDCSAGLLTLSGNNVWYANGQPLHLEQMVVGNWEDDLGVESSCWAPCSLLCIMSELLHANNLCNLKCNVCCSVTLEELFMLLDSQDPSNDRAGTDTFVEGDRLTLSVMFTNDNEAVKPVEFRLNMVITTPLV
jgi:hypothetical protein